MVFDKKSIEKVSALCYTYCAWISPVKVNISTGMKEPCENHGL